MFSLQTELMFDALNLNAKSQTVFPISMIEMKLNTVLRLITIISIKQCQIHFNVKLVINIIHS